MIENTEELEGQLIATGNVVASMIATKGAKGDKGDKGDTGNPGIDGSDGADGISPIITTSKSDKTTTITIVDAEGTKTATIVDGEDGANGQDGTDGQDGQDGFSPVANVTKSGDTATISITDANGTTTASISDGADGADGADGSDGQDGFSPIANVSKSGKIATITITDSLGTTTAEIRDGEDGQGSGDMLKSTYDTDNNGIVDNAEKVNNHTVLSDVPADAVFTDTTYTAGTGISISAQNVISNTQTSAEWGNISGTLADQTDLNTALGNKIDKSNTAGLVKNDGTIDTTTYSTFSGSYNDLSNKPTIPTKISDLTNDSNFEVTTNKVTSISSLSTDTQYPSAKCVYDNIEEITNIPANIVDASDDDMNLFDLTLGSSSLEKGYNVINFDDSYYSFGYYNTVSTTASVSNFTAIGIYVNKMFSDASTNDVLAVVSGLDTISGSNRYLSFYKSNSTTISYSTILTDGAYITSGSQGISGVKTFFSVPKLYTGLTPSNNQDLATKKYVDDNAGINIPVQDTAPLNPSEDDLWIDTSTPDFDSTNVVNQYSTSTSDVYSCNFINGTVLYESSGGTYDDISLNDDITNYKKIEVYCAKGQQNQNICSFWELSVGDSFTIFSHSWAGNPFIQMVFKEYNISNARTLTANYGGYINVAAGSVSQGEEYGLYVFKIIGYK